MGYQNINTFTKPHGSGNNNGSKSSVTIINKTSSNGLNPEYLDVKTLNANTATISNLIAENANIDNANINYFMSKTGEITKIAGSELYYSSGYIADLSSDGINTNTLKVNNEANIKSLLSDYINANKITTDYLEVTKSAHFFELIIDKMRSVQGTQINTAANCIADYVEAYDSNGHLTDIDPADISNIAYFRVYFKNTDNAGKTITNDWMTYDQAICESFNVNPGTTYDTSNKYYWRLVKKTSNDSAAQGGGLRYVNLATNEVRTTQPQQYAIEFSYFQYGTNGGASNYTDYNIQSQAAGEWTSYAYSYSGIFTPHNTIYGIEIKPADTDMILCGGNFMFNTDIETMLNIGVYYDDGTYEYFPATEYKTSYSIETLKEYDSDSNLIGKRIEAVIITTDVIDQWDACHWIDLGNVNASGQRKEYDDDGGHNPYNKSSIPSVGDNICQLGYRYDMYQTTDSEYDVSRASAIIIAAYNTPDNGDPNASPTPIRAVVPPSYAQYQQITDFDLSNHRGTYFDATGAYIKGNLMSGTTVEQGVNIPVTVEQWEFVGIPTIIKNENNTYSPASFNISILYKSDTQSIIYNSIPSGKQLFVNNNRVYSTGIISSDTLNIQLKDENDKILCATLVKANDIDILTDVNDGVDGDFSEFIYIKDNMNVSVGRNDLPASLNKKFYEYTTQEKDGWSQTAPTVDQSTEYLWMSERFVKHTVESYDPSVVTSPVIMADKSDVVLQADPNDNVIANIRVTGHLLTENVAATLSDVSGTLSINSNSLDYQNVNGEGVMLDLTFAPTTTGNYTGTITLSSNGATNVVINVSATSSTDDLASNNYLNIKKNGSISTVGWDTTKVDNIYKYTENAEEGNGWLVMSVYGAFSSIHENYTQNWINTDVTFDTSTSITDGAWSPIADDVFLGSDYYFTSTTPKSVGAQALLSSTGTSVTFFVTNVTNVKLYGHNRSWTGTTQHPMSVTAYECTVSGGTVTPSSEYTAQASSNSKDSDVNLEISNLDYTKVYEIVCKEERGTMYEIAFCTPITKDSDTAHTDDRVIVTTWGDWSTPARITGENGAQGTNAFNNIITYDRLDCSVTVSGDDLTSITSALRLRVNNLSVHHIENGTDTIIPIEHDGYTLYLDVICNTTSNNRSFTVTADSVTLPWAKTSDGVYLIQRNNVLNDIYPSAQYADPSYRDYLKLQIEHLAYLPLQFAIYCKDSNGIICTEKIIIDINMHAGYINMMTEAGLHQAFFGQYTYNGQTVYGMSIITANMQGIETNVQSLSYSYNSLSSDYTTFKQTSEQFQTTATAQFSYQSGEINTMQSQITQMPTQITAQVVTEVNGELESTGIDIENGSITLSADNTSVIGNLSLYNTGDGFTIYDVNGSGNPRISIINDTIGDIQDDYIESDITQTTNQTVSRPSTAGYQTININPIPLGTFNNNTLTLSSFSGQLSGGIKNELSSVYASLYLTTDPTATTSSTVVADGNMTMDMRNNKYYSYVLTSPTSYMTGDYYIVGSLGLTYRVDNVFTSASRNIRNTIRGKRGVAAGQKIQLIGNDGAVFKQTEQRYVWFGSDRQRMRYDNSVLENNTNGLMSNQHGFRMLNSSSNITYETSLTKFGPLPSTLPYQIISSGITTADIAANVGLVVFENNSVAVTCRMPAVSNVAKGQVIYIDNQQQSRTVTVNDSGGNPLNVTISANSTVMAINMPTSLGDNNSGWRFYSMTKL